MTTRRLESDDSKSAKRQKMSDTSDIAAKHNPYLAHMYEEEAGDAGEGGYSNGYNNGYGHGEGRNKANGVSQSTGLAGFPRHSTTAAMAMKVEDGPNNPFTGKPLSKQFFNILKTRRGLPVHAQRYISQPL